ncbi:MAG: radical SAM family heme chaperone HemW [Treponema sp.]|nr:radical SAM family heme chaperone HemW [Treponema sp.]
MNASLYIHIPFCISHCDYCDFYSEIAPSTALDRFVAVLQTELEMVFHQYHITSVPTLYMGGGTPSVLGWRRLKTILDHCNRLFPSWPAEVTVEANPESVDDALLSMLKDRGVNRISLGIQSLAEDARRAVHRSGSAAQCRIALAQTARFFPASFSVDLMAGLPFQTQDGLVDDIHEVLAAGASHVSLYSLILEEATPLAAQVHSGRIKIPCEEEAEDLWLAGRNALVHCGFNPYEVSNFALSGHESRHNMRYWRMESWLACGPGASGTIINEREGTALRYTNKANLASYLSWDTADFPPREEETLDQETLIQESLMMGFRTLMGPDEALFQRRFHQSISELIPETLSAWKHRDLIQENRLALTADGLLLLNSFLVDCFRELESSIRPSKMKAADTFD